MLLTLNIHKVKKPQSADVLSKMHSKIGISVTCHLMFKKVLRSFFAFFTKVGLKTM